jgi:hypothetical protein
MRLVPSCSRVREIKHENSSNTTGIILGDEWTVTGLRASILMCFVMQETYRFPFSLYTKMQGCRLSVLEAKYYDPTLGLSIIPSS